MLYKSTINKLIKNLSGCVYSCKNIPMSLKSYHKYQDKQMGQTNGTNKLNKHIYR